MSRAVEYGPVGSTENSLANLFAACVTAFVVGCIGVLLSIVPIIPGGTRLMVAGITLILGSVLVAGVAMTIAHFSRSKAVTIGRSGAPVRLPVKVFSMYRTDKGSVVMPDEVDLVKPRYHLILMTPEERKYEVEADAALWHRCSEGMWGYADIQGDWMKSFTIDAALYDKYSRR